MGKSLEDKIVVIGHLLCFERKIVSKNNEGTKEEIIFPKSSEELKNFIKIFRENHPELALIDDIDNIDNNKDFSSDEYIEINNCLINDEGKAKIYEVGIPVKGKVNIPTRRGFNFYIYGDCKLSQVFNQLPFGILNKNRTGVGATTLEIKSERNSIIVVPTKNLAFNKAQTGKGKYLYVGSTIKGKADSGTTKKDIIKYINNNSIPYKKIITVADSLKKVLGVLDYLKIDRNTYFLVVDEVDIIQSDSTFRPKLENVIDYYFTFGRENRALLSATIGEFSHPKVREEYMIDIDYQIPQKREINLCRTDNPNKLLCDLVLGIEGAGKIVIAYNSLTQIQIIIQLLQVYAIEKVEDKEEQKRIKQEIKDKCGILCSDASKNKVKEFYQELSMNEENKTLLPVEINFMTCAFFVGIDIDEPFHLISVSNTHVPYTLLSPNKYTQIAGRGRILGYADGRFEHQVKLADGGKVMLAAHRADNFRMGGNKFIHLVKGHAVHIHVLALLAVGNQLVRTVAALAGAAVHQRVAEVAHMAGGDPGLRVHQDSGIQADVVGAFLHKLFHPCFFDVVFELNAQGAIVPAVGKAAVNFAARVDETTVFAQVDDHVQGLFAVLHFLTPSAWLAATQSDLTGARCAVRPLL